HFFGGFLLSLESVWPPAGSGQRVEPRDVDGRTARLLGERVPCRVWFGHGQAFFPFFPASAPVPSPGQVPVSEWAPAASSRSTAARYIPWVSARPRRPSQPPFRLRAALRFRLRLPGCLRS